MPENRPPQDDEALWFPAHMSAGDSFLRVTRPDGAPDGEDDGIGLPNRRPPGGGGRRPPRKNGLKGPVWLWAALVGTAAVGTLLVVARKDIAAEITEGWLKGQGVPARVTFSKLSLGRASGTILVGDEKHPDVSVERFNAEYSLQPFAGKGQPLFRLKTLHAVHPLVAVVVKDGKLHFGSIDKLVQAALSAPSTGAAPPESIVLDDATVLLHTDYGALRTHGDVRMRAGQLTDLSLKLPQSTFEGTKGSGEIAGGYLTAKATPGGQLEVHAKLDAPRWDLRDVAVAEGAAKENLGGHDFRASNVAFALDGYVPYRKAVGLAALAGKLDTTVTLSAGAVEGAFGSTKDMHATLRLDGQTKATGKYIEYEGAAAVTSRAAAVNTTDVATQALRLDGPALGLRARYDVKDGLTVAAGGALTGEAGALCQGSLSVGGARLNLTSLSATMTASETKADFKGNISLARASVSDIALSAAQASLSGTVNAIPGEWSVKVSSDVTSGAGYSGLTPLADGRRKDPRTPEGDDIVALDRAFQRFTLRAKGLKVSLMGQAAMPPRYDVRLNGVTADLNGGGRMVLTPEKARPVLSTEAPGGFGVTVAGAGLPDLALTVSKLGYANPSDLSRLSGGYRLSGELTTVPVEGARFDARGGFVLADSGFTATLDAPVAISLHSAELGTHAENVSATISQRDGALVRVTPSGWRISGSYSGLALTAPTEALKLDGGQGAFDAFSQGTSDVLGLKLSLTGGTGADALAADKRRFNPLRLTGTLDQDTRRMTGRFVAATPAVTTATGPLPVVAIGLDNDPLSGKGRLSFDTIDLKFAPGALQPHHLSPLASGIMTRDVSGAASFTGRFDWTPGGGSSGGVLSTDGLNFTGPAGIAQGLKARIVFTSLAPLETAANQKVTVDRIQSAVPFENLDLGVQFKGDHVAIDGATVQSPGGAVRLEAMRLPLDGETPITGVVAFNGLDFGKIVAATDLRQHMVFEGRLTGRVPFTLVGEHMAFKDGGMAADGPGRISILRTGVADVTATGSVTSDSTAATGQTPAEFNPFQDLAFQAMEHLSFEQLDARVNSLPDGRVNVNFHIKGHFDPPQRQQARVSIGDYISGKWMQKPIKLPSNTPVELNLDIPVNFDDILAGLKPTGK